ncbi:vha-16 [Cordylochernes scorpioides]|uniref:V-type proton ATPase subunit n=1 Tax=Cordylochernes scorpioides TaxID=51811 RepID=A0ABY6JX27_9ARAC|nr:vha-16 [Cordylochernes scorpioides]
MGDTFFNIQHGYLEGIVRGIKSHLLGASEYANLSQCETLEDLRLSLQATDYAPVLTADIGNLDVRELEDRLRTHLVDEFNEVKRNSSEPLTTLLNYIQHGHMIDNVVMLLLGTLSGKPVAELVAKCHPLGRFPNMGTIGIATNSSELYEAVLIDTPLAPYFKECSITEEKLDELNIEVIRCVLYKSYIESFYDYCQGLGDTTAEIMAELLKLECDRRAMTISLNSLGTGLSKDIKESLLPARGHLHPYYLPELAKIDDVEQLKTIVEGLPEYKGIFDDGEENLEDKLIQKEVHMCIDSFLHQFHYGIFYAIFKLKQQEVTNLIWIAECITQKSRHKIETCIPHYP